MFKKVFRHGDRTPSNIYPLNPNNVAAWWNKYGGLTQLTQKGMYQGRQYGQYLRNIYANFLNPIYNKKEVLIKSTDYDRTLQAAYALLSGLYPPGNSTQRFDKKLDWQPIPVHATSKESDNVCSKLKLVKAYIKNILNFSC